MSKAYFTVSKRELHSALKRILNVVGVAGRLRSFLEVTIYEKHLELQVPGVSIKVPAKTNGSAKFSTLLLFMEDIVKNEKDLMLDFQLLEGELKIRTSTFLVQTTFFESDRILRSIELPVNYDFVDLMKLHLSGKYTEEEIKFNHLDKDLKKAITKTKREITHLARVLSKYGFQEKEVEELVISRLCSQIPDRVPGIIKDFK